MDVSSEENVNKRFKSDRDSKSAELLEDNGGEAVMGAAGDSVHFNPSPNTKNRSYRARSEHQEDSTEPQDDNEATANQPQETSSSAAPPHQNTTDENSPTPHQSSDRLQTVGTSPESEDPDHYSTTSDHNEADSAEGEDDDWFDYNSDEDLDHDDPDYLGNVDEDFGNVDEDLANVDEDLDNVDDDEDNVHEEGMVFSDDDDTPSLFSDSSNSQEGGDTAEDIKHHPLFKKQQPKHTWFMVKDIDRRQLGCRGNVHPRDRLQRRCYGSLHCVSRLELMYKLEEHRGCVNSLNFHPDGSLLASGSDDLKVVVWDWKIGKCLVKFKTKHEQNVFQSKFLHLSGDLHIATCARDGQVRLAQLNKEEGVRNARLLGTHNGPCHKLIVLPEQPQIVISVGEDGVVLSHDVREPKSNKLVAVKNNNIKVPLYSIHGHPLRSELFCVSGRDPLVRVYDQRKIKHPLASYTPFAPDSNSHTVRDYHVTCAVYNHLGNEILASYSESDIFLFDTKDSRPGHYVKQYQGHKNGATIKGVNFFGPQSEFVVSGSDCGHIYFWHRDTEALVQWILGDDHGVVNCLEPHPQLPYICTSGLDHDVKVWVPSCESDPKMDGLARTVKNNFRKSFGGIMHSNDANETEMLWMLWRHLRRTNRNSSTPLHLGQQDSFSDSNSSDLVDSSNDSDSDGDFDSAAQCRTS